jgi:hypothetical protein
MSAIDLNRMSGLSFEGMKPRRQHVSALGGRRFGVPERKTFTSEPFSAG